MYINSYGAYPANLYGMHKKQNAFILEIYVNFLYEDYDFDQHLNLIHVG